MHESPSTRRIYVELNNRCNLNCRFCPYHYIKEDKQELSMDSIKQLLDDINKSVSYRIIYFHNINEPFLYPYIDDVIQYCDEKEIKYGITTNGLLLDDHIETLSKSNIHTVNISYQIANTCEHEARGMTLTVNDYRTKIANSINTLLYMGFKGKIKIKLLITDEHSYFHGKLITGITSMADFISETEKIYYLFTNESLKDNNKEQIQKIQLNKHCQIEIAKQIYIETFPFLNWGNIFENPYKGRWGKCDGISGQLLIRSNGDVCPCCYDLNSDNCLGNIHSNKLSDILNKPLTLNISENINSKLLHYERCKRCFGKKSFGELVKTQINMLKSKNIAEPFLMSNNNIKLH